jgi:hypothetical protein
MMKNNKHKGQSNNKLEAKLKRQQMLEDGAYDGRFKSRVVKDKKKQSNKTWARRNEPLIFVA